jgi:hypothetical protein
MKEACGLTTLMPARTKPETLASCISKARVSSEAAYKGLLLGV